MNDEHTEGILEAEQKRSVTQKSPWKPTAFYSIAIFFGFGAAGVIAGINYGRLGKENLKWPVVIMSLLISVAMVVGLILSGSTLWWIYWLLGLLLAVIFHILQRSLYEGWKEKNPTVKGGGWFVPIGVGLGNWVLTFILFMVVAMVATPWTIQEVGDIKPLVVGQEVNGTLSSWDEYNGYSLEAEKGKCYVIATETRQTSDPLEDSALSLWYGDGITILMWDQDSGRGYNARIEWICEATGTYFITVESGDMTDIGDYTLLVTCTSK
jgi:predicted outer membrane lipoprotein